MSQNRRCKLTDAITVPPDPTRITAQEFQHLRELTFRCHNDAQAVFSTNRDEIWPSTRFGNTPRSEREFLEGISYILEQLRRSLIARRMNGGRLFVDYEGAYWKSGSTGSIEKIRFVCWNWKGDPPEQRKPSNMQYKDWVNRLR